MRDGYVGTKYSDIKQIFYDGLIKNTSYFRNIRKKLMERIITYWEDLDISIRGHIKG